MNFRLSQLAVQSIEMIDKDLSHPQAHKVEPLEVKTDADCLDWFHENATNKNIRPKYYLKQGFF